MKTSLLCARALFGLVWASGPRRIRFRSRPTNPTSGGHWRMGFPGWGHVDIAAYDSVRNPDGWRDNSNVTGHPPTLTSFPFCTVGGLRTDAPWTSFSPPDRGLQREDRCTLRYQHG